MSIVETDVEQNIQAGKAHSQLSAQIEAFNEEVDEWFSDDGKSSNKVSASNNDVVKLHYGWGSGDGGFPGRLHGQDIPLGARIIAVANAYDALINRRPGHKPVSSQDALIEISGRSGVQYDPDVVDAFIRVV